MQARARARAGDHPGLEANDRLRGEGRGLRRRPPFGLARVEAAAGRGRRAQRESVADRPVPGALERGGQQWWRWFSRGATGSADTDLRPEGAGERRRPRYGSEPKPRAPTKRPGRLASSFARRSCEESGQKARALFFVTVRAARLGSARSCRQRQQPHGFRPNHARQQHLTPGLPLPQDLQGQPRPSPRQIKPQQRQSQRWPSH